MAEQEIAATGKRELKENEQTRPGRFYVPEVDIYEDEQGLWLWADMPGVDEDHVTVELDKNVLTLQGEVVLQEYEGLSPLYTEYNVGHFLRRFTLADSGTLDAEKIKARMVNGTLELQIPRAEKTKPRRIPISAN